MQLHRLTLCAIGPFADVYEVDFERLSASGLFLLEGPTGAGKSTLIDAVVFALYGEVAGRSSSNDRMHSDVADPATSPYVELDFSTVNGLYRVRRTPKYQRAKRRGDGMTTENASAKLWRLLSPGASTEDAEPLSTRIEEVGGEIPRIVGLTYEQFVQTVVLPQGEFATFLRSAPEVRRELLQKLFGTEVYDAVLDRLVVQRKAAKQKRADAATEVSGAVRAYCGAAGFDESTQALLTALDGDALVAEVSSQLSRLSNEVGNADAAAREASVVADTARDHLVERQARESSRLRLTALSGELDALEANRDQDEQQVVALERASMASRLTSGLDGLVAAERRLDAAATELDERRSRVAVPEVDPATWPQHERSLRDAAAGLAVLSDLEGALPERVQAVADLARTRDDALNKRRAADEAIVLAPQVLSDLREQLASALTRSGRHSAALAQQESVAAVLAAATALESGQEASVEAGASVEQARQLAHRRLAEDASIRSRYIDGMAGQLASALVVDEPCPVCGSRQHPRPAVRRAGDVDRAAVDAAASSLADATSTLERATAQANQVESELSELRGRSGGVSVADAMAQMVNADLAVAELEIAVRDESRLQGEISELEKSLSEHRLQREQLTAETTRLDSLVLAAADSLATERDRIAEARDGHPTVADRMASLKREADDWHSAADSLRAVESAKADLATRADEWRQALAASPFATRDEVGSARLGDDERGRIAQTIERTRERRRQITVELASPGLLDVKIDEVVDVATAENRSSEARAANDEAQHVLANLRQRFTDTTARATSIESALAVQAETALHTAPVIRLADLVAGASSDNAKSMSLPTFVLRERFADVVSSANERLATMSDSRYALVHVEDREGNRRSGLGLRIRDTHSDLLRDPKTLSGGETFYCSLAMALGLADVVTAEAGGVDLGTLFVDEGFGSLDADTLDHVLSVLSGLSTSGRVVGIVSHVPELKERISEHVTVTSNRDGSSRLVVSA